VSSFREIAVLKRLFDMTHIGHTGTLDPIATGVLPVLFGRASKFTDHLMSNEKEYTAVMKLGLVSDTLDITGDVRETGRPVPEEEEVLSVCGRYRGDIMQIPPMYSALKVNGQKLVDLARDNIDVERKPRKVTVSYLEAEKINSDEYRLRVTCSKGTYIRSLIDDIGRDLGCGALMTELRRTRTGPFRIEDAVSTDELEMMSPEERKGSVRSIDGLFAGMERVEITDREKRFYINGARAYSHNIGQYDDGTVLCVYHGDSFLGFGIVCSEENKRKYIKSQVLLTLD